MQNTTANITKNIYQQKIFCGFFYLSSTGENQKNLKYTRSVSSPVKLEQNKQNATNKFH